MSVGLLSAAPLRDPHVVCARLAIVPLAAVKAGYRRRIAGLKQRLARA
jgi:hypothetical protein